MTLNRFDVVNIYGVFDNDDENTIHVLNSSARLFLEPYMKDKMMFEFTLKTKDNFQYTQEKALCFLLIYLDECMGDDKQWYDMIIKTKPEDIICHDLYDHVPTINELQPFTNVAFIGDTIHPMAPTLGMGCNSGLLDCESLMRTILNNGTVFDYHKEMVGRVEPIVFKSRYNMYFYHSEDCLNKDKLMDFKGYV